MNTLIVRMVECTDSDTVYGFLLIRSDKEVTEKEVQDKIYEIKSTFTDASDLPADYVSKDGEVLSDEYTVSDIIDRLPKEWDVDYYENAEVEV